MLDFVIVVVIVVGVAVAGLVVSLCAVAPAQSVTEFPIPVLKKDFPLGTLDLQLDKEPLFRTRRVIATLCPTSFDLTRAASWRARRIDRSDVFGLAVAPAGYCSGRTPMPTRLLR